MNVYISISNDHIFPAIVMPYVKNEEGKSILELLQERCAECKFTNGIAYNEFKWVENCLEWKSSDAGSICEKWSDDSYNQLFASKEVFENLLVGYLSHPIFSSSGMALGINAYAPGACVKDKALNTIKNHYCNAFDEYYRMLRSKYPILYAYGFGNMSMYGNVRKLGYDSTCDYVGVFYPIIDCNNLAIICELNFAEQSCIEKIPIYCEGINAVDPPFHWSSSSCIGIYECKNNFYSYYVRSFNGKSIFLSEIGSLSSEFSTYSTYLSGASYEWDEKYMRKTINIYGITNVRDFQEQVDMIEADVAVFLDSGYLRGNRRLKGVIIFSDDLLPFKSQLYYYNFPPTNKPMDDFIRLLGDMND